MFDNVIAYLNHERGVAFARISESEYEGYVNVQGNSVKLSISLGNGFPKEFPIIRILEPIGFIPHASSDGVLCLFDKESVMIKPNMAEELLLDSYDRAITILAMKPQRQKQEVFREFFAYWKERTRKAYCLYSSLPEAAKTEYQEYTAIGPSRGCLVVSSDVYHTKALLINHMKCNPEKIETYRIPCVRIRLRSSLRPPQMNRAFQWKEIKNYIRSNITKSQKRQFDLLLTMKAKVINRLLLLAIPSEAGDQYACFWLYYRRMKSKSSLRNISDCQVDAVTTFRIDQQYILARGGAETTLNEKRVLLIGCGSVGGFLAENLCQCGVGALDILDKDRLSIDNIHRHVLGFDDAMTEDYKADLIKSYLEARFPYVDIDSMRFEDRTVETFLKEPKRLQNYDLIVSATGNPTADLAINDTLHQMDEAPPLVVCFNEPYGIGGHAIAALKTGACLRCLYSDSISGQLMPFLGSFVKPDQSFSKNISGCAGSFVEYSVLDSQQTAIMASRLIIDVLKGVCNHSRLVSWVGLADKLREAGFNTSEHYEELERNERNSFSKDISCAMRCRTCGN